MPEAGGGPIFAAFVGVKWILWLSPVSPKLTNPKLLNPDRVEVVSWGFEAIGSKVMRLRV